MAAEELDIRVAAGRASCLDELTELLPNSISHAGKACNDDVAASESKVNRFREVEDVEALVGCQYRVGENRSFVIAGNKDDRGSCVSDLEERFESQLYEMSRYFAAVEKVSSMDDQVDLAGSCGLQSASRVRKEIRATTPTFDSWSEREVEAEVCIGQHQHLEHRVSLARLLSLSPSFSLLPARLRARARNQRQRPRP
jgi:hypothetical protein